MKKRTITAISAGLTLTGLLIILQGSILAAEKKNLGDMKFDSKVESMKKAGVGPVIFPHTKHEEKLECEECHPGIFKEKRGANNIYMKMNMDGKFCGSPNCHNSERAFPLYLCANCHTKVGAVK